MEPARTRVELAIPPRDESKKGGIEQPFSNTRHPRILRSNEGQGGGRRQVAKQVLALPPAQLEMPVPVLDATVLTGEENLEPLVGVPATPRESRKE